MRLIAICAIASFGLSPSFLIAEETVERQQPVQYNPPAAKEGYSYPDCFCTDSQGSRVEMGQNACLQIGSRQVWARCEMSLNTPAWRHDGEGCPTS